jgi:hypothetical protein
MLRTAKVYALDRLLPTRFGGKAGRGLALESRRRERAGQADSLFRPVLTVCSQDSENPSVTGHNAGCKHQFAAEREEHRTWT